MVVFVLSPVEIFSKRKYRSHYLTLTHWRSLLYAFKILSESKLGAMIAIVSPLFQPEMRAVTIINLLTNA